MATASAREQLFLELVNRARMDPLGESARYGINLNKDLAAGTISATPKQVLAFNPLLNNSADGHSQWMLDQDIFSHTGINGSSSNGRMVSAGYVFSGNWRSGENIAWSGSTGSYNGDTAVFDHHRDLFLSHGHRTNIMGDTYKEIGIGSLTGQFTTGGRTYNGLMSTQNFAVSGTDSFVTGVAYNDTDLNAFYSIGEGVSGLVVELFDNGQLIETGATELAGGYSLGTAELGEFTLLYSGGTLVGSMGASFVLTGSNVKIDLVNGNTIQSNASAALAGAALGLNLLGVSNIDGLGNDLDNTLNGNNGNNRLAGGAGNDTLKGGAGSDTAVFSGALASYTISNNPTSGIVTLTNSEDGTDRVSGIEFFQFSDGTRSLAQVIASVPVTPVASIAGASASGNEGNEGTSVRSFTVTLSAASTSTQTVSYAVAGSGINAANASDFASGLSGTLTFAAGETSKTIEVLVQGDLVQEQTETFNVTLSNLSGGLELGAASAVGTIINDEIPPQVINGTKKSNALTGGAGVDYINGLDGTDTLNGLGGDDIIDGGNGSDTAVYSGASGSYITSYDNGTGRFTISGGSDGMDTVVGVESFRFSDGTLSAGQLRGFAAVLNGSKKANTLNGSIGADEINGLAGNDVLNGGTGNDKLNGGLGNDRMTGGAGADTFCFTDVAFGSDTITDFTDGLDMFQVALPLADAFTDFAVVGNGTNLVTVTVGTNQVVIAGASPITLDASDFLFV